MSSAPNLPEPNNHPVSKNMQNRIANTMVAGVLVALAIMIIGIIVYLFQHHGLEPNRHTFNGEPKFLENFFSITYSAFSGNITAILQLGVVVLLLNPLLRVGMIAYGFMIEKNRMYTLISLFVFCVLLFSFFY